jgi:hypothetical protein
VTAAAAAAGWGKAVVVADMGGRISNPSAFNSGAFGVIMSLKANRQHLRILGSSCPAEELDSVLLVNTQTRKQ